MRRDRHEIAAFPLRRSLTDQPAGRPAVEQSSRHLGVAGGPEVPEVFAAVSPKTAQMLRLTALSHHSRFGILIVRHQDDGKDLRDLRTSGAVSTFCG
jgi:hypothetical protein